MEKYAVIETGGKQYRVITGSVLSVERLEAEADSEIVLDRVLALSDGDSLQVGTPALEGVQLTAKVIEHYRGAKVVNFKKKRRKGYKRKQGHRQELTKIEILEVGGGGGKPASAPKKEEKPAEADVAEKADVTSEGETNGS